MIIMGINTLKNTRGYTLVEVMVSMVIAFIVLGGVYQTITRETIDRDRETIILDMQNNARVSVDRITREIRRTGFFGCGDLDDLAANSLNDAGAVDTIVGTKTDADGTIPGNPDYWRGLTTILDELIGSANVDYLGTPLAHSNDAAAGHPLYDEETDAISLVYLSGDVPLGVVMGATTTNPITLATPAFTKGDILLITDCRQYSLFQKTNCSNIAAVNHTATPTDDCPGETPALVPRNIDANLGRAYGNEAPTRVYNLAISTFFVVGSELKHNLTSRTIASNIEDLQFEFVNAAPGDTDLSDNGWSETVTAAPSVVRAIRVWVLAMSDEMKDYTNTETYDYPNSPYYSGSNPFTSGNGAGGAPNDNRYRYLTSSAVYLRNAGTD